jgi:hypothetical protein
LRSSRLFKEGSLYQMFWALEVWSQLHP